jgi:D-alanine-D-alanine ligase
MTKKLVGVIFGGKSGEHEVSLVSASSVIKEMPKDKYDIREIGISKDGKWYIADSTSGGLMEKFKTEDLGGLEAVSFEKALEGCDIAFPVLHGPYGEDGTIQGLFEMLAIPYVGCGVLASSACMDKIICKDVLDRAGLSVVPYVSFLRSEWSTGRDEILAKVESEVGYPCFVKPSNMGSSVGISKVLAGDGAGDSLTEAIELAAKFDSRILVEKGINAREIECAVLGNSSPEAAELGEILVGGEFYDYHDKYVDGKSSTQVPVQDIDDAKKAEISEMCLKAYKTMDCSGLSRVDCFLDRDSGDIYLNEINTLPGFTSISMYPKMWKASGVSYPELIDRLVELGFERDAERSKNQISFDSGSDWFQTP